MSREVLSRPQTRPARGANGSIDIAALVEGPLGCQPIQIRGMDAGHPVTAQRVPPLLIGQDQQYILLIIHISGSFRPPVRDERSLPLSIHLAGLIPMGSTSVVSHR